MVKCFDAGMDEKPVPGEYVHVMENEDTKAAESFETSASNEFNDTQLENRPVCPTCKQSFATVFTLRAHLRYKHKEKLDEVKRIPCMEEGCDYYTRIIDDLVNHLRTKHQKPIDSQHLTFKTQQGKSYYCSFCESWPSRDQLLSKIEL